MASERLKEGALLNGRYAIQEVVGRGGMGTVYKARDTRLEITVAVKEMTERDVTPDERVAAVRQFEREAKLLGQLQHGNLPRVTDYFVEDDHCYLIMEFVVGRTIESILREAKGAALPLIDVLDWAVQLSDVLSYLHGQDPPIVFRDIKPANIMLQDDSVVKLIDFGIARRFQAGATKDTLLYGSPGYSPPEQYGRAQTDPRSDIYALGATLHHLITGRDPSPTPFKFPAIRAIDPTLPVALDTFIGRCVEMDEERRVQTAEEARDTLIHIRTALVAAEAAATRQQAAAKPGTGGKPGHPTGPKVVSSRVQAAQEARFVRRLAGVVGVVLLVACLAAVAIRFRPQGGPPPAVAVKVPPPITPSRGTQKPDHTEPSDKTVVRLVTTPPGATVAVDGKEVGASPVELTDLAPGKHTVHFTPPRDSGLAEATREITVETGQTKEIETALLPIGGGSGAVSSSSPAATIQNMNAQTVQLTEPPRPGLRMGLTFRVTGAAGKSGVAMVYFYGSDLSTPLKPRGEAEHFQSQEGQLSVSQNFRVETDPSDFPDFAVTIPEAVFPVDSYSKVSYRAVIFIEGKIAVQTEIKPLQVSTR